MKKTHYILLILGISLLTACSNNSDTVSSSENTGQGGSLATFILKGNYLYTVDYNKLTVFHIKEIANPIKVNAVEVGFNIETLFSYQNFLFIGSQDAMFIYDITNAELPKKLSQSNHFRACDPVVANDTHAYVTLHTNTFCQGSFNELRTYDIKDIENPSLLNVRGLTAPKGLSIYKDNYLLVCDDTVKIFDISTPEASIFIDEIQTKNAIDIIIKNNHAFIISEHSISQYLLNNNDIKNFKKVSVFNF
ncbi:MAG: hypothetical protein ACPGU6_04110 [Tenacibaculum sp.]